MARRGSLTPAQRRAIAALLVARDVRTAAQQANVAERSLHRWLGEAEFQAELQRRADEAVQNSLHRLSELSRLVVDLLRVELTRFDGGATSYSRLRAAELILGHLTRLKEMVEVQKRLEAVEQALERRKQ